MLSGSFRATAAAVALALVAVACTGTEVTAPPEPDGVAAEAVEPLEPLERPEDGGGTLRIGLSTDPASLDPRFLSDGSGELIVDSLFDPLVRTDADGRVVPAAAERWEVSDDGDEFTFHLREASFHDGTPVTAGDFARTFNRIADGTADPASFLAYLLTPVAGAAEAQASGAPLSGIEVVDASTLRIRLAEPEPAFLVALSHPSLVPVPVVADEDLAAFASQPVGNGPFAMAGPREPGAFVRLSRFADHPEPPLLDEVVLTVYSDAQGLERQWSDLVEGQLHVADLDPQRREEAVEAFGASPDGYQGPGVLDGITSPVYLYGFDTTAAPFDDVRIRRALSLAIDREALAEEVMRGTRAAATSLVPPPLPGSTEGACEYCRHDPAAAAELLAEARAGLGAADEISGADETDTDVPEPGPVLDRLTLSHTRGDTHAAIAERMATDIESALGIEVDFQAQELQAFIQAVRAGELPVFRLGWEVTVPDPGAYLHPLFDSSQVGLDNLSRYTEPEVDELLDLARQADSDRRRLAGYRLAEARILEDMPVLPLLWYRHSTVVDPEVRDLVYSPFGHMNLDEVWLDPDVE